MSDVIAGFTAALLQEVGPVPIGDVFHSRFTIYDLTEGGPVED